jgi:hypothetical protein
MDLWLLATLQKLEQQISDIKTIVHDTHHLLQRLAILATLWGAVATLGYNSQAAQDLLVAVLKTTFKLP